MNIADLCGEINLTNGSLLHSNFENRLPGTRIVVRLPMSAWSRRVALSMPGRLLSMTPYSLILQSGCTHCQQHLMLSSGGHTIYHECGEQGQALYDVVDVGRGIEQVQAIVDQDEKESTKDTAHYRATSPGEFRASEDDCGNDSELDSNTDSGLQSSDPGQKNQGGHSGDDSTDGVRQHSHGAARQIGLTGRPHRTLHGTGIHAQVRMVQDIHTRHEYDEQKDSGHRHAENSSIAQKPHFSRHGNILCASHVNGHAAIDRIRGKCRDQG